MPFQSQNLSTLHLCNYFKVHCTFVFFFTTTNSYFASSFSLAIPFLRSFSLSRDSCQSSFVFKHFLRAAFSTFPQFEKRQHSSTFDSFNYCLCYYFSSIQLSLESCKKISKNSQKKKQEQHQILYEPIATSSRGQMTVDVVEMEMPK